jgi:hypothetical protein
MKKKVIEISFTPLQWAEIYLSVEMKLTSLKNGEFGYTPRLTKKRIHGLADILDEIETKVEV